MSSFEFAFPMKLWPVWFGAGAVVVFLVYLVLRRLDTARAARLHAFVEAALAPRLLEGYDARLQRPLLWLTLAGVGFLLLAFAQPKWGQGLLELGREGRDVLVLLDTSESMNAANPAPSRLAKARQKIESLLERLPGDRVGLVAFSGGSALECPLTLDHAHFKNALVNVDTNTIDEEGTNIQAALDTARETFEEDAKKSDSESRDARAIVLISDGEQVSGDAVAMAKQLAPIANVYVIGIGDPNGATVDYPNFNLQYQVYPQNRAPHLSKLDEDTLAKIATEGQGMYVRATADDTDVGHIATALQGLSSHAISGELRFNLVDRYQWPLAVALLCFALEGLWLVLMPSVRRWLNRRRRAREAATLAKYAVMLLACVAFSSGAVAESTASRLGLAQEKLRGGDAAGAVEMLRELRVEQPGDERIAYALGCAQYKVAQAANGGADAYKDAQGAFEGLAAAKDPEIARNALFNRANCLAQAAKAQLNDPKQAQAALGALRSAAAAFEDFLRKYPDDPGAQQNLDHVRFLLKKLQREQKKDEKKEDQQDKKNEPTPQASLAVRNAQTEIPGATAVVGEDNTVKLVAPGAQGATK